MKSTKPGIEIGYIFGQLTVVAFVKTGYKKAPNGILCKCICGGTTVLQASAIRSGTRKSCGCAPRGITVKHGHTAGGRWSPEYSSWASMMGRCEDPNSTSFRNYGGRGIGVCDRWKTFENFLSDMGARPSLQHSLDRVDSNGDYEPSNCRWSDWKTQNRNRRSTHFVTIGAETASIAEWAERYGITYNAAHYRIRSGLPLVKRKQSDG